MGASTHETMVKEIFAAMEQQDWDAVVAYYHDDVVVEWPQSGERLQGKEACLNVFRNYPDGMPRTMVRRVTGDGDLVVAEGEVAYPDGSTWSAVDIIELRDGKIIRETSYFAEAFDAPDWRASMVEAV